MLVDIESNQPLEKKRKAGILMVEWQMHKL